MEFRTQVKIENMGLEIQPLEPMLFVGSCFAASIGRRFGEEKFPVIVNPHGVMYNPVSVLHSVTSYLSPPTTCIPVAFSPQSHLSSPTSPRITFLTLGTNHVYRLKETGEIVDNCQKRPQSLFQEEELTVDECVGYLSQAVDELLRHRPDARIVITVSPIRYAKYGFHGSQLSKATLLLAAEELARRYECVTYFPAYEIVVDELRDYRFYQIDMLHPSLLTVEYIWERLVETCFSDRARQFLREWQPVKLALAHRPINPDSPEYQQFLAEARENEKKLLAKYQ